MPEEVNTDEERSADMAGQPPERLRAIVAPKRFAVLGIPHSRRKGLKPIFSKTSFFVFPLSEDDENWSTDADGRDTTTPEATTVPMPIKALLDSGAMSEEEFTRFLCSLGVRRSEVHEVLDNGRWSFITAADKPVEKPWAETGEGQSEEEAN